MAERYFTTRKCDMRYEKCCKFLRGGWNERSLSPFLFFFIFFWKLLKSLSFWNRSRVKVNERRGVETAEIGSSRQIYFWRRRRSGMKFQFGTVAIAPRFREFRYNISRLSARSSSSQSCRNSLLNRRNYARPIRVNRESSWIFRNLVTFFFFPRLLLLFHPDILPFKRA